MLLPPYRQPTIADLLLCEKLRNPHNTLANCDKRHTPATTLITPVSFYTQYLYKAKFTVCDMSSAKRPLLKPNPFISLRDPKTGKWRVIFTFPQGKLVQSTFSSDSFSPEQAQPET